MKERVTPSPFSRRYPGYTVVAAGFVVQGTIVGAVFTYGVFFDAIQADLGWSRAVIAAGSSLASLVMGIGAMIFGRLTDVTGPRKILSIAGILITLGYLFMSRISAPWHLLLVYPLFVGVVFATHDVVTLSTVARWFDRRRGRMSAIVKAGTGLGQVIGPAAAAILIAAFGWRTAYLWIAAVTGPLVFFAARYAHRSPEALGVPHGDLPARPAGMGATATDKGAVQPVGTFQMMKRPEFRRLCIAQGVVFFCAPVIVVHVVPYATDMGISRTMAAGVLSVLGGVSIVGRLVMGSVIDRVGGRIALLGCYAVLLLAFILLQFAVNAPMLYLFAAVYGFAHGGLFTAVSPLVAELFGMRAHGLLYGTVTFAGTVGGAMGPTAAGAIYDLTGSYRPAFLLLIVLVLFAAGAIASINPSKSS